MWSFYGEYSKLTLAMAKVRITNVAVLNNPSKFLEPFQFQITFECQDIQHGEIFISLSVFFRVQKELINSLLSVRYITLLLGEPKYYIRFPVSARVDIFSHDIMGVSNIIQFQ